MTLMAKINPLTDEILIYPLKLEVMRQEYPLIGWPANPTEATLSSFPEYVVVQPTTVPVARDFVESLSHTAQKVGDHWEQYWTVNQLSLSDAKTILRNMAVQIYQEKMEMPFTVQEVVDAATTHGTSMIYRGVIVDREAKFNPKLVQVRNYIQAATTVEDAYDIYQELVALI